MKTVHCQLTGQDGNAFAIMGRVTRALRDAGKVDAIAAYRQEATKGDYDNVLRVSMQVLEDNGIEYS